MKCVKCCYNCKYIHQLETNLIWQCDADGKPVNPDNLCDKHTPKEDE